MRGLLVLFFVFSFVFNVVPVQAAMLHLGLSAGGNWTMLNATAGATTYDMNGFGYGAGANLSLMQDHLLGLHLTGDYIFHNPAQGTDRFFAHTVAISGIASIQFNLGGARHSIGAGYSYGMNYSKQLTPATLPIPDSMKGIVIQGKDMWKVGSEHYAYLVLRAYIWPTMMNMNLPLTMASYLLMLGFDL